jgi:molybdopterin/thiamine biosynthesis adenylyltransferase
VSYGAENQRFVNQIRVPHDVFGKPTVVVELPVGAERVPGAAAAFVLAGNLLCRIFERVHLVAPNLELEPHPWGVRNLEAAAEVLNQLAVGSVMWGRPGTADIVLGVGAAPTIAATRRTFVSFSPWTAAVEQVLPANGEAIVGPLFAACFGASQVFLHSAQLVEAVYRPMPPFVFSALTYGHEDVLVATTGQLELPASHLVGVGAVGSALVYTLGHTRAKGLLDPIDDDFVDDTNLQRYILMRKSDVNAAKVDVAVECLRHTGIVVRPHPMTFKTFVAEHGSKIDLLITPIDSEIGRRRLAAFLPRTVLNAATGHTKVTISSHGFADGKACLGCLYLPEQNETTVEQRLAADMGLPVQEVEDHLADNAPANEDLVRRVERHRGLAPGKLSEWVGKRLQSLYQRAVCGEAAIEVAGATVVSPLSFISATAGVLLAGELLKLASPELRPYALNNYFRLDTLAKPNSSMLSVKPQEPSGRCICHDGDYVDVYREKYSLMK